MDFFVFFWWIFVACVGGLLIILLVTDSRKRSASPKYSHPIPSHGTPPKKVSAEDLGPIVFNHARLNSVYMVQNLDNKFDTNTKGWLFLYGICYSLCFETMALQKAYGESAAHDVLNHATKSLQRFIVYFMHDEEMAFRIPDEIDSIFTGITAIFNSDDPYPIATVSNHFFADATDSHEHDYSAELRIEIRAYVATWIKLASSLPEEYKLISPLGTK